MMKRILTKSSAAISRPALKTLRQGCRKGEARHRARYDKWQENVSSASEESTSRLNEESEAVTAWEDSFCAWQQRWTGAG